MGIVISQQMFRAHSWQSRARVGFSRLLRLSVWVLLFCSLQSSVALAQLTASDASNVRDHIYKGNSLLQHHEFSKAIAEYEQALLTDPSSTTAKENIVLTHNNWGISLFRQKKYSEASLQWNAALKLNPYDRNAKNNLRILKNAMANLGIDATSPAQALPGERTSEGLGDSKEQMVSPVNGSRPGLVDTTTIPNAVIINRSDSKPHQPASDSSSSSNSIEGPKPPATLPESVKGTDFPTQTSSKKLQPSPSEGLGGANIEEKLAALEMRVYGRQSKELPILQRLERLERDTSARPSLGSISDRLQTLLKTYGL